jgi:uncharacterized protein YdhG (YjbR/CyaY superfamily)
MPFVSVADYLDALPPETRERMQRLRQIVLETAPGVEERISYQMPAYFLHGRLVYFCAFAKHIGFYPANMTVFQAFADDLRPYKQSGRGTVQFSHSEPFPEDLIRKMVAFRVRQNKE